MSALQRFNVLYTFDVDTTFEHKLSRPTVRWIPHNVTVIVSRPSLYATSMGIRYIETSITICNFHWYQILLRRPSLHATFIGIRYY